MTISPIQKVAVIGAGVMGTQIAACMTNAGISVLLYDVATEGGACRSALSQNAVQKCLKDKRTPFMLKQNAELITPCNMDDDLEKLKDADWIIECVTEEPRAKAKIYRAIEPFRKEGSIVSSNTSTIPLRLLMEGQSDALKNNFVITHFFNPVRYTSVVEFVSVADTKPEIVAALNQFCDYRLGKTIVHAKDSPGFIANRLGMFFLLSAVHATYDLGLRIEETDAICGQPLGLPSTGVFGLLDLIGIDLFPKIIHNMAMLLPAADPLVEKAEIIRLLQKMCDEGHTGRKGDGGFYRHVSNKNGGYDLQVFDLLSQTYVAHQAVDAPAANSARQSIRSLCSSADRYGMLAWRVLSETLVYAASLMPDLATSIVDVDTVMRLGYNWKMGPFELIDKIGVDWLMAQLREDNRPIPAYLLHAAGRSFYREKNACLEYLLDNDEYARLERPAGILLLEDFKREREPLAENGSARLWDIDDGVLCFEFASKANTITPETLQLLRQTIDYISVSIEDNNHQWRGLVFYNEGQFFSAGADLKIFADAEDANYTAADAFIQGGREVLRALRYAPFPTVAAPFGYTLAGGCELVLHCSAAQAYVETQMGLVEMNIGLLPGWDGCLQLMGRASVARHQFGSDVPPANHAYEMVSQRKVSTSAAEAAKLLLLRPSDGITTNRNRLLFDAKKRVLEMAQNYVPPKPWKLSFAGAVGRSIFELVLEGYKVSGQTTPYDLVLCRDLAALLCGREGDPVGPVDETIITEVTSSIFAKLLRSPETIARLTYFLNTGELLRV